MSKIKNLSWQDALKRLKEGNERFQKDKLDGQLQDSKRRGSLTGGQSPYAIILSCADSRVVPELAFDTGLGEIFVIRVAGNIANTSSVASIEYAVAHLGVNLIMVLGHESCGAVGAAIAGGDNGHNLNMLLAHITPAVCIEKERMEERDKLVRQKDKEAREGNNEFAQLGEPAQLDTNDVVRTNAAFNATDLYNRSSIIRGAVDSRNLKIIPAFYNLGSGKVDCLSHCEA